MVFMTIMTRGAARFFRFFPKSQSGRTETPVVSHFADPSKMGRWLIKLLQKAQRLLPNEETPCGDLD